MKKIQTALFWIFCFSNLVGNAQLNPVCKNGSHHTFTTAPANLRSDTIDVIKTTINLNITDFTTNIISGNSRIRFAPKLNGQNHIMLDLLKMTIDSIKNLNNTLIFQYDDTLLKVNLAAVINTTDTIDVDVYYHGAPQLDPSGWGGFYFSSGYAFNLGVGFDVKPHNFGRAWYPAVDNFAERCKFEFNITTSNGKIAYCNGYLAHDTTIGTLRTRRWIMNKEIPSYLASVAVAAYTHVNQTINGTNGPIPVMLTALPSDTTALKNSFINLPDAITKFEKSYGPYKWNRIGYCLVPFANGAMEHATNIAYPKAAVTGGVLYEDIIMSHELSHHWWGDLLTCETAEDMWINEGMASYSSYLFNEEVYGYNTYLTKVKETHQPNVQFAHLKEKGFLTLNNIPHEFTYGDHVYNKGADIAHTMRSYVGDSLFFVGLKYVMQQQEGKTMNSTEFRDLMTTSTGVNMNDFFNDWVFNPGWPHFSIDSFNVSGTFPNYNVMLYVKQKLFGAPNYYQNVPLEVCFMDVNRVKTIRKITMTGVSMNFSIPLNFYPVYAGMNFNSKISDAISSDYKTIKQSSGNITFGMADFTLQPLASGIDSSVIRVEHNFAAPDSVKFNTNNYRLTKQHYWKIDGQLASGFYAKGLFYFDGRKVTAGLTGYLDTSLTVTTADSIVLLYRADRSKDWVEYPHYVRFKIGGTLSKYGYMRADSIKLGEYAFANGVSTVIGINEISENENGIKVFPNPTDNYFEIEMDRNYTSEGVTIFDTAGKEVYSKRNYKSNEHISTTAWQKGIYFIEIKTKENKVIKEKILVQ